jgi:hypothetical protein
VLGCRSLGKKISALTEEMAAVEAMLNGAAASNQVGCALLALSVQHLLPRCLH